MFPSKRILCSTDFSEASVQAFSSAVEIALHNEAEIYLVHVLPTLLSDGGDSTVMVSLPQYERLLQPKQRMEEMARPMLAKGLKVETLITRGDPASEIVRIAKQKAVDLHCDCYPRKNRLASPGLWIRCRKSCPHGELPRTQHPLRGSRRRCFCRRALIRLCEDAGRLGRQKLMGPFFSVTGFLPLRINLLRHTRTETEACHPEFTVPKKKKESRHSSRRLQLFQS